MVLRGFARGQRIDLEEPLPYTDGQPLNVTVEAVHEGFPLGSPALILKALNEIPKVRSEDVDELGRQIEAGHLPVRTGGVFDAD